MHGHSTSHQLIELTHDIMQSLDNQELICLIFCDVSKAFDRVWLRGLLLKLERYGIKGSLLRWIESYISNREQQVIIKETISLKGNLKALVPQAIYYKHIALFRSKSCEKDDIILQDIL
jgi:hypothetical protein